MRLPKPAIGLLQAGPLESRRPKESGARRRGRLTPEAPRRSSEARNHEARSDRGSGSKSARSPCREIRLRSCGDLRRLEGPRKGHEPPLGPAPSEVAIEKDRKLSPLGAVSAVYYRIETSGSDSNCLKVEADPTFSLPGSTVGGFRWSQGRAMLNLRLNALRQRRLFQEV